MKLSSKVTSKKYAAGLEQGTGENTKDRLLRVQQFTLKNLSSDTMTVRVK